MKKISCLICLSLVLVFLSSCKRECVCTGSHPTIEAEEVHSYGKMSRDECNDKMYRMNKDTVLTTNKIWICK